MRKLSIAIAVLALAAASAGTLNHHKTIPSTQQGVFPPPTCPPDCGGPGDPPVD